MKKFALTLLSLAGIIFCANGCEGIVDGDPCNNPGASTCDWGDVYTCDSNYRYYRSSICSTSQVCHENLGYAACYSTCSESQVGLENYSCVGDEIQIERCTKMTGYSTPVWVYERAISLCTDDYNYFSCTAGRRYDFSCPVTYDKSGVCIPDAFIKNGAYEAGCN